MYMQYNDYRYLSITLQVHNHRPYLKKDGKDHPYFKLFSPSPCIWLRHVS